MATTKNFHEFQHEGADQFTKMTNAMKAVLHPHIGQTDVFKEIDDKVLSLTVTIDRQGFSVAIKKNTCKNESNI